MTTNENQEFNPLALDNQICFALYVCSKEIIRKYNPLLEPLGLTYTAYITLLCLWEKDNVTVKDLGARLFLDSGTLTPVINKLEKKGYISKHRSQDDARGVLVEITDEGKKLREEIVNVPSMMGGCVNLSEQDSKDLYRILYTILGRFDELDSQ
jgi:DNA-binding MarR family transcriptional regulator